MSETLVHEVGAVYSKEKALRHAGRGLARDMGKRFVWIEVGLALVQWFSLGLVLV